MPDYTWPEPGKRNYIGKRISRVDGPLKSSGRAKYTYDLVRPGMLYGKVVRSPYAHARVVSIDTSAAEKMPGVKAIHIVQGPGKEVFWAGDDIVAVAAVDERTAEDAARAIKVEYEQLPHLVVDSEEPKSGIDSTAPLSKTDLLALIDTDAAPNQVVEQVHNRGIGFQPTSELLGQWRDQHIKETILEAVQKAEVKNGPTDSWYKVTGKQTQGDADKAFQEADVVSEGTYGQPVITHCCLETHGGIAEWTDDQNLLAHFSTQNVPGIAEQLGSAIGIPAANISVHQDHVGGGFGSKLGLDRWGITAAQLSKKAGGKPVKIMLERDSELKVAGCRPSAYARVKVGAKKDGTLTAWESYSWGSGGVGGGGSPPLPYVMNVPNQVKQHTGVVNNIGPARAWRAPNHPQACLITLSALDDLTAKLNMNPLEFYRKNIALAKPREKIYLEEFDVADKLMGWSSRWHPRGDQTSGPVKRGLGVSIHTWGGRGHNSQCDLTIFPDGSVEIKMGTQDIGTGTRTVILMIAADALGIPMENIKLLIGDNSYPPDGASGGSSTIGGVSSSTFRAAVDALDQLFAKVAPALNVQATELEAAGGSIRVTKDPTRSISWREACSKLGPHSLTVRGKNPGPGDLINSGVGGVQMADVSVDVETGIVKINKMVCVQDCGLVINLKTAESQCLGALIMGVSYALYEEKVMDQATGIMLNPHMDSYRLAGLGDVGELVVHMMTGPGYDERGVIGLGEPPTVSPGAAISNAVANAIGVRVPFLPLTPDRVLQALENASGERA
ncbi:MAG TPA: xanthine dehydrogenase family protein molybdopterin-binding subunit [Terriglobales bacterium]|jgi:xanthine dehydrogenase YagR molybdenum-binding subunit|nr:xanthine dehydrogenase family protein molybdopterin-binding subunit [Terriglobales bacterium]